MLARRSERTSVTSFPQNLFVSFSQVLQSNRNPEIKKVTDVFTRTILVCPKIWEFRPK